MSVRVRTLVHGEIADRLADLARLRIAVFREWPYLYDGDAAYEADYLTAFAAAPYAVLVAAFDGGDIVGMATASPMAAQDAAVRDPMMAHGMDVDATFYFGESVLLPGYRGQGVGHAFFDRREAGARRAGAGMAAFCSVIRPADHPLHPASPRHHHDFWRGRGYGEVPGLTCTMRWRDIGDVSETTHVLQYWSRAL